jgi:PAS domain S-box-containing protein
MLMAYNISIVYTVANFLLAVILVLQAPKNANSRFYLFCVAMLDCMGLLSIYLKNAPFGDVRLVHIIFVFCFSLLPFFFFHFITVFIRHGELMRSKRNLALLYFAGLFSYAMMLLHYLPEPITGANEVTRTGYLFYITWHSILFCVGVAMLYEHSQGFLGRVEKTNLLFAGFAVLLLIVPGPFSETILFGIFHLTIDWYFFTCTIAVIFGVYFILRYKIVVNTIFDALKSALAVLNDVFIITDENLKIKVARGALTPLLEYEERELVGRNFTEIVEQKDLLLSYRQFVAEGKMTEGYFDADVLKRNGERLPMNFSITPIFAEQEVSGFVSVGRSVSELRKSERSLRLFNHAVESASSCVILTDLDDNIIYVNKALLEKYQYKSEELLGKPIDLLRSRNNPPDIINSINDKRFVEKWSGELLAVSKEGVEFPVWRMSSPIYNEQNECLGCVTFTEDITEKKRAELALQASEKKYRALFDNVPVGIFQVSPSEKVITANSTLAKMFGFGAADEAFFQYMSNEIQVDPRAKEAWERLRTEGTEINNMEINFKLKDQNKELSFLQNSHAFRNDRNEVEYYEGTLTEITDRKKLEDELRHAQRMESIGTLAGGIAHDFNNILQVILIYAMKLRKQLNDPLEFEKSIENISKHINRGASLVRQLMTFARKMEVVFSPVDVNGAIEDLRKLIMQTFPANIEICLDLCPETVMIFADQTQFHQVLLNLCVNSRDAMPDGGFITISTQLACNGTAKKYFADALEKKYVLISVTDTGMGMDKSVQQRIFEPFYTTKEIGKGTGLGLAVVYGIVENHKGFIKVESELGKGTTFRILLPFLDHKQASSASFLEGLGEIPGGTETILLAEDEVEIRDQIKSLLEAKGYRTLVAKDGLETVDVYRANHQAIAVVLLDMGMPKMSGWQAYFSMKKINPKINAIVCTGYLDPDKKTEMLEAGVKDFVQKPSMPDDILRKIRKVLDRTN